MPSRSVRRALARKPLPSRTYTLDPFLKGDLAGFHIVMSSMTGRDLIRLLSDEMTEAEAMSLTASKIVEHDIDTDDLLSLDLAVLLEISKAWREAQKDVAVPPTSGNS